MNPDERKVYGDSPFFGINLGVDQCGSIKVGDKVLDLHIKTLVTFNEIIFLFCYNTLKSLFHRINRSSLVNRSLKITPIKHHQQWQKVKIEGSVEKCNSLFNSSKYHTIIVFDNEML